MYSTALCIQYTVLKGSPTERRFFCSISASCVFFLYKNNYKIKKAEKGMHMWISFAGIRTNFILFVRPVLLCWSFVLLGGVASFKFNYFSETAFEQKNVAMTGRHAYNPSTDLPPCLPFYNPSEERPLCLPFYNPCEEWPPCLPFYNPSKDWPPCLPFYNPSEEWPPYCLPFYNPIVRNGRHVYPSKMVCLTIFLFPSFIHQQYHSLSLICWL